MSIDPTQIRIDTRADQHLSPMPPQAPRGTFACLSAAVAIVLCLLLGVVVVVAMLEPFSPVADDFWTDAAADLEDQYRIVVDAGAPQIDRAIRAGAVAEAYLQGKDKAAYRRWKAIAERHTRAAGLPMP